jgi:hypothetical protein
MANYSPQNPPKNLTLNQFRAAADNAGQFAKQCRFVARINGVGSQISGLVSNDLMYMCDAVEFPGRGFDVTQIRYYGPSQVFPNNTMYNTANMSFLCRTGSAERAFFDDWMDVINPTDSWNYEYADNYYAEIQIFQLAEWGGPENLKVTDPKSLAKYDGPPQAVYGWTLHKAWPTLVTPQSVTWADNDILRLQVTFTYKYWDRPGYSR